ncbi:MAG TPA: hypothetical protein VF065_05330, partial [Ilumatobacter sp.]
TITNIFNSGLGANAALAVGNFFTALAYGGRDGVTPKPDVIYAARGTNVLVRETNTTGTAADFTTRAVPGASEILDVVLDPDDWETAYVIDSQKVYKTTDQGANWDVISDNLDAIDLKSLEIVKTVGGDKVLLVGASQGVYRAINPVVDVEWTELGAGLPNALVRDIDFANRLGALDDVLLAGTMGRGAWTLAGDADTVLELESQIVIGGTSGDDEVQIRRNPDNASLLDIFINSLTPIFTVPLASVGEIVFNGSGGNDTLTVDSTHGAIDVPGGIHFDGGDGTDELVLNGNEVVSKSSTVDGGVTRLEIEDLASDATQVVFRENVETLTDNLPGASNIEILGDGFEDFLDWLDRLSDPGEGLQQELAVLGNSLPRVLTGVPVGRGTIPAGTPEGEEEETPQALPGGFEALQGIRRLIETGAGAFNLDDIGSGALATFDDLRDALDALDGDDGNVSFQTVGDTTTFTVEIVKQITGTADFTVEAEEFGGEIDLGGVIDISADVVLTLEFGFDSSGFFVNTGASSEELKVHHIVLEGDAHAAGQFGFLDIETEVETFTVDDTIALVVDLQDPMGDGKLRVSDFGTSLGDKVDVTLDSDPAADDVTLTVTASAASILPGLESIDLGGAELTLTWADITDPGTLDITAGGGLSQDLIDFLSVDVQEVLDQISQLDELADALEGFDVPLLQDTLSALADAADFISREIIQPVTSLSGGQANFHSIQNLVMRLARSTGVDPAALGLAYDDGELTWHLDFGTSFVASDDLDLGFNSDSTGLADLSFDTDGSIEGTLGFEFTVGIDIGAIVAGDDPDEWFFLRDAAASATLDIEATAINAEARFGFLSIGIEGGTAEAEAGFLITLNDPGT